MTTALAVAALVLALCLFGGLWSILRAPADVDRVLAVQLLGTTGVALVLVLGPAFGVGGTVEVALVLTLLAAVTTVVFARGTAAPEARDEAPPPSSGRTP